MFNFWRSATISDRLIEDDDLPSHFTDLHGTETTGRSTHSKSWRRESHRRRSSEMTPKAVQSINIRFQQKKQQTFTAYPVFDMSNLPHIVNLRRLMLLLCMMCVCIAPCVYLPMAAMQRTTHLQNCFLNATIYILETNDSSSRKSDNNGRLQSLVVDEDEEEAYGFYPLLTVWGDEYWCNYITYTAVSVSIFSTIIGWATLQIWPELMSVGQGGVLALLYLVLTSAALSTWAVATYRLSWGLMVTCQNLHLKTQAGGNIRIDCRNITLNYKYIDTEDPEQANEWDLEFWMELVMTACWMLTGLLTFEIVVTVVMFAVIWWYYHLLPSMLSAGTGTQTHTPTRDNSQQDNRLPFLREGESW